jgi:tRNA A-37 threonylcarbamoyl transferase component Bud32
VATERINNMPNITTDFLHDISFSHLKHANRATLRAFQLALSDSKDLLFCEEIVRVIPGKRLVAFARYGHKQVVAKLFYEPRRAARHAEREYQGIQALLNTGVHTPDLLYHGRSQDKKIHVLLFERILDADSLDDLWQQRASFKEVLPLMQAMIMELATHHVLGILQHDLHFKNFLVKDSKIYTIDGGDLEIFDRPLSKKDSLDNLGLFFSQLGVGSEELKKTLFQTYSEARSWIVKKYDIAYLNASVERSTARRLEHYSKKILRNSSAFTRTARLGAITVYDRTYEGSEFLQFLKNPESLFAAPETQILKAGRSATVAKVKLDNHYFVLKRYNIKGVQHWLRRCLRPTRAANNWRLAQRLRLLGIPTARAAAFIEKRFLNLRGKSYFLMEYIAGQNAGEFFATHQDENGSTRFIAQQMIALFENLASLRITHGDLKMTNILISRQPLLIDLDGMREHKTMAGFKRAFQQEIKRFMHNWRDNRSVYEMFELLVKEIFRRLGVQQT